MSRRLLVRTPRRARPFSCSACVSWGSPRLALAGLPIDVAPEVQQAMHEGRPVVAMESAVITHGLPLPHSVDLPLACSHILRAQGVTPASIGIVAGRIKVGLTDDEVRFLAQKGFESRTDAQKRETMWKVGRRELPAALVKGCDGGTTVSATMAISQIAGLRFFSTGGIGGVHRGAETSYDISSDLTSLSDTPVVVICAGSKSILDIGLTLEYLETLAVPVGTLGSSAWPAFYTPDSGFKSPMVFDSALEVARTVLLSERLQLPTSLLLGVPIPEEHHAAGSAIQQSVEQAVAESVENGMSRRGKLVTPWLLERVSQLSKGLAITSNLALIKNNVKTGGEVALAYAKLRAEGGMEQPSTFMPALPSPSLPTHNVLPIAKFSPPTPSPLLVVGSLAIDLSMNPTSSPLSTTSPGRVSLSLGGVANNIAYAAFSLGVKDVMLVSPVGADMFGAIARKGLKERGMRADGLVEEQGSSTAVCGILLDEGGELVGGVADMGITTELSGHQVIAKIKENAPKLVCLDGNLSVETLSEVLQHCQINCIPTFYEPTSDAKSLKVLKAIEQPRFEGFHSQNYERSIPILSYSTPNLHELKILFSHIRETESASIFEQGLWFDYINVSSVDMEARLPKWIVQEGVAIMGISLLSTVRTVIIKSGARGVLVVSRVSGDDVARWTKLPRRKGLLVTASSGGPPEAIVLQHFPALELLGAEQGSVTGAGDSLAGAICAALVSGTELGTPEGMRRVVEIGQRAAVATLKSSEAVGDFSSIRLDEL